MYFDFGEVIKLNEVKEFKNIKKAINKIQDSYYFKDKDITYDGLNDNTSKQNKELLNTFNEDENKLLAELLTYSQNGKYNENIVYRTSIGSRKKVLNYMYWKYRVLDSDVKINLGDLKRILKIKVDDKYINPIEIEVECDICGKNATVFVNTLNKDDFSFECKNCKHKENKEKENVFPVICKCNRCNELNDNFFQTIKRNFDGLINEVEKQIEIYYNSIKEVINITDEEMNNDYLIYRSELDRDVREVMSFNPRDRQSLANIIRKLHERNKVYDKDYGVKIYSKLFNIRALYRINIKEELSMVKDKIINKLIFKLNEDDHRTIKEIQNFIRECDNFEIFKEKVECNNDRITFELNFNSYDFILDESIFGGYSNPFFKEISILNKYYFNEKEITKGNIDLERYIKNIFKSEHQKSVYIDLKNKYSKYVVLPNYKSSDIIDCEKIKHMLSKVEFDYLKKCYFNFVICDFEGNPLKVIEFQKGEHHNEKEWIEKDNMKRKICEVAKIEFEEIF